MLSYTWLGKLPLFGVNGYRVQIIIEFVTRHKLQVKYFLNFNSQRTIGTQLYSSKHLQALLSDKKKKRLNVCLQSMFKNKVYCSLFTKIKKKYTKEVKS